MGQDPMIDRFDFSDLRELFAKANEEKSGKPVGRYRRAIGTRASRGEAQTCRFDTGEKGKQGR
jgi:hypothetical protein